MNDILRSLLYDLALNARRILTEETRNLLAAIYGLGTDGRFEPVSKLPAVQSLPEVAETRKQLDRYLRNEESAGRTRAESVERLVRETAFTHVNRLVALKLLETRRLIRGTLDKLHESNGFKFYLADHPEDETRYQAGDLPQDALGEGPRDAAYRHFLLWQTSQLAREVPVLFDAQNLSSRLFPRPRALRSLIDALNAPELRDAWTPGNEETIGWVYQYFNSQELEQAFREARLSGKKFEREDIPAVTQLFTPRWIVRFLVENTLGRHWLQMHPDSRLVADLAYLVPLAADLLPTPLKPVHELTLLDPACGAMHFGLVAFDLFAAMYREELERAGEPGWPTHPSVDHADAIPAAILTHNLFGIDIDLRAVQLAALSLYLRAKTLNPKAILTPRNLVCADVTVLNGNRLGAFVDALGHTQPIVETALRTLWPHLKQAGEFGSLLRLENDLRSLFVSNRRGKRETGMQLLPGLEDTNVGSFTAFNDLDAQIRAALNEFARHEAIRGDDATAFVAGAEQGLKLLDLLQRRYDVVVTNPPYLSGRKMNARMKTFVNESYPNSKLDLYAAFIQRCLNLCRNDGYVGMLTMHSFMFISSYESLRTDIGQEAAITCLLHLGPALFSVGNPGTLQTAAYVLQREASSTQRVDSIGTYFRLVREPDAEAKQAAFERAVTQLQAQGHHRDTEAPSIQSVYRYRQGDFDAISGAPWVYWVTPGLRRLFVELPKLGDIAPAIRGTATHDNFRFLRYWWEVKYHHIAFESRSWHDFEQSGRTYALYMKGGSFQRWFGNQEYVLQLEQQGAILVQFLNEKRDTIRGQQYIFRPGVTYSFLTSSTFNARLSPGGFIFDVAGSSLFPQNIALMLAVLNSQFVRYALQLINPTVNFQVGDLARLPIPTQISVVLNDLVERAIALAKEASIESETTYDFVAPPTWPDGPHVVDARHAELAAVERTIDEEVYQLYGISATDRAAIEAELYHRDTEVPSIEQEESDSESDDEQSATDNQQLTPADLARRWLSYAVGVALGRFQPGVEGAIGRGRFAPEVAAQLRALADEDGIGLIEPGHPDDLGRRVQRTLELIHGEETAQQIIDQATERKPLHDYLIRSFYKAHATQYRKRPVYWLLQSPRRNYSLLIFHERMTGDSLPLILGNRYVQGRINALRSRLGELQATTHSLAGREKRQAERERDEVADTLADAEEFARLIRNAMEYKNERSAVVGWRPEIDDGVLINLAPLHTLIPAWATEPKKCWQALQHGDYDWSHTAMRYWPERVLAKCKTNKSYAIAHGVVQNNP